VIISLNTVSRDILGRDNNFVCYLKRMY
jgi:hypothetical protein